MTWNVGGGRAPRSPQKPRISNRSGCRGFRILSIHSGSIGPSLVLIVAYASCGQDPSFQRGAL